jgi:hypothetical protein
MNCELFVQQTSDDSLETFELLLLLLLLAVVAHSSATAALTQACLHGDQRGPGVGRRVRREREREREREAVVKSRGPAGWRMRPRGRKAGKVVW